MMVDSLITSMTTLLRLHQPTNIKQAGPALASAGPD